MKKKLEAELISIAHRILKLKNRAELDQLQQETLKLYEKISVLRFVEDNFNDVKPTIGYASAEEKLEDIYGLAEEPQAEEPQGTSQQPSEESQDPTPNTQNPGQDEENDKGEGVTADSNAEEVVSEEEKEATEEAEEEPQAANQHSAEEEETTNPQPATEKPEGDADPEQPVEEYQASEEEKEITEEKEGEETESSESQSQSVEEIRNEQPEKEALAAAPKAHNPESSTGFSFDFEPKKEDEPKQKEITFEDYRDYKEPEFVKKGQEPKVEESVPEPANVQKEWLPKEPEVIQQQEENARDWRDWEPAKDEPKVEEPQATSQEPTAASVQSQSQSSAPIRNPQPATGSARALNLGLNDRIAFEKNLFGGSGEDLNRVISQLNTFDTFDEAKEFIADMVKPDYNNWQGKEEYEERFLALVEKKFD